MPKEKNKIDINKHENDINTLKKQNVIDLLSIKELYKRIEELGEKITQIKYIDNTLVKKIKKEYEKLNKIILDENIQVKLTNDIKSINSQMDDIAYYPINNIQLQDSLENFNNTILNTNIKHSNLTIGDNKTFKSDKLSKIETVDNTPINSSLINLKNRKNILIENIVFDGNKNNVTGDAESGTKLINIENCDTIYIRRNIFKNNNYLAISILNSRNIFIEYNYFEDVDCNLITFGGCENIHFIKNISNGGASEMASIYGDSLDNKDKKVFIKDNICINKSKGSAIYLKYCADIYIDNNIIENCSNALGVSDSIVNSPILENINFINNTIRNCNNGIHSKCFLDSVISNNKLYNINTIGIYDINSENSLFENNYVFGAGQSGDNAKGDYRFEKSKNIIFKNNRSKSNNGKNEYFIYLSMTENISILNSLSYSNNFFSIENNCVNTIIKNSKGQINNNSIDTKIFNHTHTWLTPYIDFAIPNNSIADFNTRYFSDVIYIDGQKTGNTPQLIKITPSYKGRIIKLIAKSGFFINTDDTNSNIVTRSPFTINNYMIELFFDESNWIEVSRL